MDGHRVHDVVVLEIDGKVRVVPARDRRLSHGVVHERLLSHVEVTFLGLVFSVGIETVQLFLPTRAADVNDVFWNTVGALVGALAAHLHAVVEIEWA